jgi:hypothetical protein
MIVDRAIDWACLSARVEKLVSATCEASLGDGVFICTISHIFYYVSQQYFSLTRLFRPANRLARVVVERKGTVAGFATLLQLRSFVSSRCYGNSFRDIELQATQSYCFVWRWSWSTDGKYSIHSKL